MTSASADNDFRPSSPGCVGAAIAAAADVAPVSLLLEDATVVAVVKFCRGGSASALPLAEWLRFVWVRCSGVTVLDAGGIGRGVARLGAGCRDGGGKNLEFSKPLGFRKTHLQMLARLASQTRYDEEEI